MSRKGEMKRLGLTLFMDSPLHREAWTILSALPARQRTEAICLALCRERERDAILERKPLEDLEFDLADVDSDGKISILDIGVLRDYILQRIDKIEKP